MPPSADKHNLLRSPPLHPLTAVDAALPSAPSAAAAAGAPAHVPSLALRPRLSITFADTTASPRPPRSTSPDGFQGRLPPAFFSSGAPNPLVRKLQILYWPAPAQLLIAGLVSGYLSAGWRSRPHVAELCLGLKASAGSLWNQPRCVHLLKLCQAVERIPKLLLLAALAPRWLHARL